MNCWYCEEQLIWKDDKAVSPHQFERERREFMTTFSCPNCDAYVKVFKPFEETSVEV